MSINNSMKDQFWQLIDRRDQIVTQAAPLRAMRDNLRNESTERLRDMESKIRTVEADLFELDQDIATIARALKNKVGERPVEPNPTEQITAE